MPLSIRRFALPASITLSFPLALSLGAGTLGGCGGDDPSSSAPPTSEADASADAGGDATSEPGADTGAGADADAATPVDGDARSTVAGKILSESENVAGVKIVIGDKTATTDANGAFSIDDVTFPYTLHAIVPTELTFAGRGPIVYGFAELSTPNPVVEVSAKVTHSEADFDGKVAVQDPSALTQKSRFRLLAMGGETVSGSGSSGPAQQAGNGPIPYAATLRWPLAQGTKSGSLVAVVYTFADGYDDYTKPGIPTSYAYASSTKVFATNGKTYTDPVFPALVAVGSKTVAGTIEAPAGYTVKTHYLELASAADEKNMFSFLENKADTSFSYAVPDVSILNAVHITVRATTANGDSSTVGSVVTPGTSGIALVLTKAPEAIAPAANAAGVKTGDVLSWSSESDDCLYRASFSSANDGTTMFSLTTTSTQIAIPDLAAYGAGLAVSAPYSWNVTCTHQGKSNPSIDDAVKLGGTPSLSWATSGARKFLTL